MNASVTEQNHKKRCIQRIDLPVASIPVAPAAAAAGTAGAHTGVLSLVTFPHDTMDTIGTRSAAVSALINFT